MSAGPGPVLATDLLRAAFSQAAAARAGGNHPFGALLADEQGNILATAQNSVVTTGDITGHAELNLVREAFQAFDQQVLNAATVYSSTEPCAMCCGAIFWAGIGGVVFGLSQESLHALAGDSENSLNMPCRDVFGHGGRPVDVRGPLLEAEAGELHRGFWA